MMRRHMRLLLALTAVGWLGCGSYPSVTCGVGTHQGVLLCIPDAPLDFSGFFDQPDMAGSTDMPPPPPDMVTPPVRGTRIDRQVSESGATVVDLPNDLTGDTVEALTPAVIAGSGAGDGTFVILGVPLAPYVLHYDDGFQHEYIFGAARTFDFGLTFVGRFDANFASPGTQLSFNAVTGMTPWAAGDELEYVSVTAGLQDHLYAAQLGGITPGATALTKIEPWDSMPLIQGSKGDALFVNQFVPTATSTGVTVTALAKSAHVPSFDMVDANTVVVGVGGVAAAFAAPSPKTAALDLRLSQFGSFTFGPGAGVPSWFLMLFAVAGGTVTPLDGAATLVTYSPVTGSDIDLGTVTYGDPFPAGYNRELSVFANDGFAFTAPGATSSSTETSGISCTGKLSSFGSGPIVPLVGPPAYPRINGTSAYTIAAAVGATPTLTWSVPVGAVTWYEVIIRHVIKSGTATQIKSVASLVTTQTSMVIPAGILMPGEKYLFHFRSVYRPGGDPTRPFRGGVPDCQADTISTMVGR
jgi:hypothetical protein